MTAIQKLILTLFPCSYGYFVMVSTYLLDAEINLQACSY